MDYKVLLFDLDGTLLSDDKTISHYTFEIIQKCRQKGFLIGFATSRSEKNSLKFITELVPDILISSNGALLRFHNKSLCLSKFTLEETRNLISDIRRICGADCSITVDTLNAHYRNYELSLEELKEGWGESIFSDFADFRQEALKICVEIPDFNIADKLKKHCSDCDFARFFNSYWYKLNPKNVTKENAIIKLCSCFSISPESIIAFGDDSVDIEMLKLCGLGIAMGNAIPEVKAIADDVIETNENDGIAKYLSQKFNLNM